ncbi:hypothetical protein ABBQ32_009917 [Trebouxia sp. C0010 RCD-2024]
MEGSLRSRAVCSLGSLYVVLWWSMRPRNSQVVGQSWTDDGVEAAVMDFAQDAAHYSRQGLASRIKRIHPPIQHSSAWLRKQLLAWGHGYGIASVKMRRSGSQPMPTHLM